MWLCVDRFEKKSGAVDLGIAPKPHVHILLNIELFIRGVAVYSTKNIAVSDFFRHAKDLKTPKISPASKFIDH